MYRSAKGSGILHNIKFIQNGVDEVRRKTVVCVDKLNNGGSYVKLPQKQQQPVINKCGNQSDQEPIQTVLLSDIIEAARVIENPTEIVIKIDIELFECRAFLGSPNIFNQPQDVPIVAIIMEWLYGRGDGSFTDRCPEEKMKLMAKMFLEAGYVPFSIHFRRLDYSDLGEEWKTNVLWLHRVHGRNIINRI